MIFTYIVFFLMAKFGLPMRVAVALGVFVIPSVVLTVWVARIGDKPPSDAITIVPKPGTTPEKSGTSKDPGAAK